MEVGGREDGGDDENSADKFNDAHMLKYYAKKSDFVCNS